MENLILTKTHLTPQVNFSGNGSLLIKGVSTPEDVKAFYQPVIEWITVFKKSAPKTVSLVMEMDYLNTSSTHTLSQIMAMLHSIKQDGASVKLVWHYDEEDEDMLDLGQDLKISSKSEVEFVPIKKN